MGLKPQLKTVRNQRGFTLVELMLVLALLGLVLAGISQFFNFTNRAYTDADSQTLSIQEANLFTNQIEREVRSAAKPNDATHALRIQSFGEQLDIYSYNSSTNQYKRTSYRLNPDDKSQLQKGWVVATASSTIPGTSANPQYASIPSSGDGAWKTVVTNMDSYIPGSEYLFLDATDDSTVTAERRVVKINLKILDPDTNRPLSVQTSCMSRSGRSSTSIIASGNYTAPADKLVTDIKVLDTSSTDEVTSISAAAHASSKTVKAVVDPPNAKSLMVNWSSSDTWITFANTSTHSGDTQTINIGEFTKDTGPTRTATITVKSADSNKTITLQVTQTRIMVTGVSVSPTQISLNNGQASIKTAVAVVSNSDADNKALIWSSNKSWITFGPGGTSTTAISNSGEEQTINISKFDTGTGSERNATITITAADGSNKYAVITVTQPRILVTSVSVTPTAISTNNGGTTASAKATVSPSDADNQKVTWTSNQTSWVRFGTSSSGPFSTTITSNSGDTIYINISSKTGNSTRTAKITVTAADGSGKYAEINVTQTRN